MRGRVARLSLVIAVAVASGFPTAAGARWDVGRAPTAPVQHAAASGAPSIAPSSGPTDTGRVIVKLRKAPTASSRRALQMDDSKPVNGPTLVTEAPPQGVSTEEYAEQLEESTLVEYAEPDYLLQPAGYTATPNDPDFRDPARSWALRGEGSAHFDEVWPALANQKAAAPGAVRVAVIDTGYYMDHPARGANIFAARDECATYNAVTGISTKDADVRPVSMADIAGAAHGTMTASQIGEKTNDGLGSAGTAWDTQVAIYKVQGVVSVAENDPGNPGALKVGDPVIPSSALVNAIDDAVADARTAHARLVINISLVLVGALSSDGDVKQIQAAINRAHSAGAVIVAASGNEYGESVGYPAACNYVIAVGAYQLNESTTTRADFSNYGSELDITAPGRLIWGPTKPGTLTDGDFEHPGYMWWSGTSMAAPYVAAAAALLLRLEPTLTADKVESLLKSTAVDMGAPGRDDIYGSGLLDAYAAYWLAAPRTTTDWKPRYATSATINFSVLDSHSVETTTWHTLDVNPDAEGLAIDGASVTTDDLDTYTLRYWSVSKGVKEDTHTVTFDVLPEDTTSPVTSCDAASTYTGKAPISFTATDAYGWGVDTTYYKVAGETTRTGSSVTIGKAGEHTVRYWSTDLRGNTEDAKIATFTVTPAKASATIARSASTIRRGSNIRLSGSLTPGRVGDVVRIWYRSPGSHTWRYFTSSTKYYRRTVTSVISSGRGTWSPLTHRLSKHGRYYFRVVYNGDGTYYSRTPSTSNTVSVYVR